MNSNSSMFANFVKFILLIVLRLGGIGGCFALTGIR